MSTEVTKPNPVAAVRKFEEETKDRVMAKIEAQIEAGDLLIPGNFAWKNAVQSAWLHLLEVVDKNSKPALDVCTPASVATAFLDMIQQGLSVTKKQGYFVVYGTKLQFDPSYFGTITVAKRDSDLKEVNAVPIYKKDAFEYEIDSNSGRRKVISHVQKLENINPNELIGAYAVLTFNDGTVSTEIMTMEQVRTSWGMGGSKGNSPAHSKFPDRMAGKTVINRALNILNASADDSSLMPDDDAQTATVKNTITSKANKQSLTLTEDIPHVNVETNEKPKSTIQPNTEFDNQQEEREEVKTEPAEKEPVKSEPAAGKPGELSFTND